MKELKGACIVGQSGGPTAAINASILGVIEAAMASGSVTRVLGAANGIKGVLGDMFYDLGDEDPFEISLLRHSPSAALGSSRYMLSRDNIDETEYEKILEMFKKYDVRYFFFTGGNDSMDTCNKISKYMKKVGYDCRIIGIPKTIDNDLYGTDHCPGYGSAAKYVATSCMEVYHDLHVYDTSSVVIMEIMGRNAGWLTGASGLASFKGCGPDLIYLPERPFDHNLFSEQVKDVFFKKGKCFVAVSEGIKDAEGKYIASYGSNTANQMDAFGHAQMGGLAYVLSNIVNAQRKTKIRAIELSLLQRCAAHCASKTDIEEAYNAGRLAMESALEGVSDRMIAFRRKPGDEYACEYIAQPLDIVANTEKKVPLEWINAEGNGVTREFIDYALPLIQGEVELRREDGLPRFAKLAKRLVNEGEKCTVDGSCVIPAV